MIQQTLSPQEPERERHQNSRVRIHCGGWNKNGPRRPIYLNIYQELALFKKD